LALLLAGILVVFTKQFHLLIVTAMLGPITYIFFMALVAFWLSQVSLGSKVKYALSGCLILTTVMGLYFFNKELFDWYLAAGQAVAVWAQNENIENWRFYRDSLALRYPILFGTFLFGSLVGLLRKPRLTTYLVICFSAPIILHSIWFP